MWQDENTGKDFQLENLEATLQGAALNERVVHAELCTVGIPREPWDFVSKAVAAGHPRSFGGALERKWSWICFARIFPVNLICW